MLLNNFDPTAWITVRTYYTVAGVEVTPGPVSWSPATDPVAFLNWWFLLGSTETYGPYRIEVSSDKPADDGVVATYEYRTKSW